MVEAGDEKEPKSKRHFFGCKCEVKDLLVLCVLAEDCNQPDYVKFVKALCADHKINLLTVPTAKTLGEWAGDYGEETTALNIVKKHIESN
ncbi:unnamed protein product [Microthlaspi erraticum]|uniref:Ribosomal protein eL8/eL30/eS12/Gadd45 domain-containing protein n=1 Tax=Microthlaspi erraticum TaxID=1685480 RepID=A0A6D2KQ23_9BRAS|nr:unnamed protein product [Microthlaspi erraticum]